MIRLILGMVLIAATPAWAQTTVPASAPSNATVAPAPPISRVDAAKYKVEGNIAYDHYSQTMLDMIYPKEPSTEKRPGVIMFHGGGWIRTDKSTMSTFYNPYLAHGFVVCNVEYRMAGKDNAGNPTPGSAIAPAAVEDALTSAKWFWDHADQYNVDKTRIVVTGASAGGHLALMVGMCTPEASLGPTAPADFKIAAIVNGYGPPDVPDLLQRKTAWAIQWLPADTPDRDALAKRLSPITYVRKDIPPLLTVQGSRDTTVPVAQNQHLTAALKELGADADMYLAQGASHGFTAATWPGVNHEIFDIFLPKHGIIKTAATQPSP